MFKFANEVNSCLLEIKKGNKNPFFNELFEMTAVHLIIVARTYLANKDLAEDVVSVMYSRVMKYIQSFKPDQDGYNWLCRITQHVAYTFNRKEQKVACAERAFALKQPIDAVEQSFDLIDFYMMIDQLEEIDREIALQRFLEGRVLQDIGDRLNLSKVAVHQRLRKINKFISKKIKIDKQI